jgi:uncharacterized membrane protein (DUF373 family)
LRLWIPVAFIIFVLVALEFYNLLGAYQKQGGLTLEVVNELGLVVVVLGVVAAGIILMRASPPE